MIAIKAVLLKPDFSSPLPAAAADAEEEEETVLDTVVTRAGAERETVLRDEITDEEEDEAIGAIVVGAEAVLDDARIAVELDEDGTEEDVSTSDEATGTSV
jgi:hypothetical protein